MVIEWESHKVAPDEAFSQMRHSLEALQTQIELAVREASDLEFFRRNSGQTKCSRPQKLRVDPLVVLAQRLITGGPLPALVVREQARALGGETYKRR
jgi:hypothetical protein